MTQRKRRRPKTANGESNADPDVCRVLRVAIIVGNPELLRLFRLFDEVRDLMSEEVRAACDDLRRIGAFGKEGNPEWT